MAYTVYVAVLVPAYLREYGPANFLWFSDVALLVGLAAIWLEQPLLAGTQAIAVLVPELVWNAEFLLRLTTGLRIVGANDYMFDPSIPLPVRALSLFHLWLPVVLVWMVICLGYDRRALAAQTAIGTSVLIATYLLAPPENNVNWVHDWGFVRSPWSFLLSIIAFPLAVYLPAHVVLASAVAPPARFRSSR